MAFQSMLNGAECSTSSNPLSQLMKHSNADSSLQQDRIAGQGGAGPSSAFRHAGAREGGGPSMEEQAFFRHQQQQHSGAAFNMGALRYELGNMHHAPQHNHGGAWSQEMNSRQHSQRPMDMANMEAAFAGSRMGAGGGGDQQGQSWRDQFAMNGSGGAGGSDGSAAQMSANPMMSMGMSRGTMMGGGGGMMYGAGLGRMGSYAPSSTQTSSQQQSSDKRFVELDDAGWKAQFDALEQADSTAETTSKGKGKARAEEPVVVDELPSEADQEASIRRALDDLDSGLRADEAHHSRFEELWNAMQAGNAPQENARTNEDLAKWEEELMNAGAEQRMRDLSGLDGHEDALLDGFGSLGDDGFPRLGTYRFNTENPFRDHESPMQEGLRILSEPGRGSLADAALLFEAATARAGAATPAEATASEQAAKGEVDQGKRERSEAWRRLGEAQAMNERETQAIRALEEAVRIDGTNLEALMSLSISYTNDGYDAAAHATLERYMSVSYPELIAASTGTDTKAASSDPWSSLNRVTDLFLRAARQGAAQGTIDPDVQIGLGVLFYSASSYDQARDCFATALEARPNDFLLWNRLGATLANGGKPEEAIEAYTKALELRPTFTRAIYNLSVSCLNLGAHHQAAEHLLAALSLQATQTAGLPELPAGAANGPPSATGAMQEHQESHNLWSTLRRIFLSMDRMDLAQLAHVGGDIEVFRKEGFEF